jgi:hypothetical protein
MSVPSVHQPADLAHDPIWVVDDDDGVVDSYQLPKNLFRYVLSVI